MLNKKRVLVTSGGTSEYIDDVRVLTNISTGRLGAIIAETLEAAGHTVTYLCARSAVLPTRSTSATHADNYSPNVVVSTCTDVKSLMEKMEILVPEHDIIIHAMAVSDFGFKRDKPVKLKSNDPQAFIQHMKENIVINPKILPLIKKWNPDCKVVSFKFEVGRTFEQLAAQALYSMTSTSGDLVVANDKDEMKREQQHIAYIMGHQDNIDLVDKNNKYRAFDDGNEEYFAIKAIGKQDIANMLVKYVESI